MYRRSSLILLVGALAGCPPDYPPTGLDSDGGGGGGGGVPSVREVDCSAVTADHEVQIVSLAFQPEAMTVQSGDVVRWTNDDPFPHTVTSGNPGDTDAGSAFDSGQMQPGDAYCLQFDEAAEWVYFCAVHPTQMAGATVTVE